MFVKKGFPLHKLYAILNGGVSTNGSTKYTKNNTLSKRSKMCELEISLKRALALLVSHPDTTRTIVSYITLPERNRQTKNGKKSSSLHKCKSKLEQVLGELS